MEPTQQAAPDPEAIDRLRYRWLLDDERGRAIARDILLITGVDEPPVLADAGGLAYRAGAQGAGWKIRELLQRHHPNGWLQLESERLAEKRELQRQALEREQEERATRPPEETAP